MFIDDAIQTGLQHHQAGRLAEAERIYRHVLSVHPEHSGALHLLGLIANQLGQREAAVALISLAIQRQPANAEAHGNLGKVLFDLGRLEESVASCSEAVRLKPGFAAAYTNLSNALRELGRWDQSVAAAKCAIEIDPQFAAAHNNLGNALKEQGQLDEAFASFTRAIQLKPDYAEAFNNLGVVLKFQSHLEASALALSRAIELNPDIAEAHNNLGNVMKELGRLDEALECYKRAVTIKPDYAHADSNRVYTLHFHPGYDAAALLQAGQDWDRRHALPRRALLRSHDNAGDPQRRLRIGYVSPDFREHPIGRLLLPLLTHHDKRQVEVCAYSQTCLTDSITDRLRSHSDRWRTIIGLSDDHVADLIRKDGVDILVDLTMHMDRNRLLVFARKPAPVQVTYLAYCSTTGLDAIDYRLSDPYLDPFEGGKPFDEAQGPPPTAVETMYSEQTVRLPESYWCYVPYQAAPAIGPLPALERGGITFGCLNNFTRVSESAFGVWAALLLNVRGSRLLLHAPEGIHRQRLKDQLQRKGIEPNRIDFAGFMPLEKYLACYGQIDIALDTFPYGGGTTTCDALWMGVPVVTLVGRTAVGRGGLSVLSNIGLPELVARSTDEYVRIASELADDLSRLSNLRSTIRQRMHRSPLTDAPRFAQNIEAAYRQMWRRWCERQRCEGHVTN